MNKFTETELFVSRYELLKMFFKEENFVIDSFLIGKLAAHIISWEDKEKEVESVPPYRITPEHAHCKCMNLDKGCENNHYADCKLCRIYPHDGSVKRREN